MTFTFEEFCKRMQAEIIKYLPGDYKDCKTVIMPCNKPGKHYAGLYIASPDRNCSPILNLSDLYERAEQGECVKDFLEQYSNRNEEWYKWSLKKQLENLGWKFSGGKLSETEW